MPEETDISKDLAGGVRGLFDRIGEFFHLFDLSFFVSGTVTFSALAYWSSRQKGQSVAFPSSTWIRVIALVVFCYVCGLLSFAAGRCAAGIWRRDLPSRRKFFTKFLRDVIADHGISAPEIEAYLNGDDKPWRLYERLWVDARESRQRAASFAILNRYWVMAATYDGIAVSCALWVPVLALAPPFQGLINWVALPALAALASALSFWQGHNYFKFQVHEVIATLAASRKRLMTEIQTALPGEVPPGPARS